MRINLYIEVFFLQFMLNEKNAKGLKVYRLLTYYKNNDLLVHFKFDGGPEKGAFQNGNIIDLSQEKLTLVLKERIQGNKPILLEWIDPNSISKFRDVNKK